MDKKLEKYLKREILNITNMVNQRDAPGMEFAVSDAYNIYLSGCRAQADADRVAVVKAYPYPRALIMQGNVIKALATAEIKE